MNSEMRNVNSEKPNYEVVNPYHFIPLSQKCCKNKIEDQTLEDLKTGKITIEIETKTPLFIPNISSQFDEPIIDEPNNLHSSYEFFSYHSYEKGEKRKPYEPVIPGSEIRGMIRSIYEAITGSCMSAIELDKPLYKRTSDYYNCGMFVYKDGIIKLYKMRKSEVVKCELKNGMLDNYKDGDKVYFTKKYNKTGYRVQNIWSSKEQADNNAEVGYLLKGEMGPEIKETKTQKIKHFARIFSLDGVEKQEINIREYINSFESVLNTYADERVNKNLGSKHLGYAVYKGEWEKLKKGEREYLPVYYSSFKVDNQSIISYLSPACITKESYITTLEDTIKNCKTDFTPCTTKNEICPACQLFGMVGKKSSDSIASKLRFADARVEKKENQVSEYYFKNYITLEELAQPKISATEMYLQRPRNGKAEFWTYDYYTVKSNEKRDNKILGYTEKEPVRIMGRKFYWHFPFENTKPDKTIRNKTVRLLNTGVKFIEDIYFENITDDQLKQLKYLLDISRTKKKNGTFLGYKLGTGKPLGLGSITLKINEIKLREFDLNSEKIYVEREENIGNISYEDAGFDNGVKQAFMLMINSESVWNRPVSYPLTEQQYEKMFSNGIVRKVPLKEGFKWFGENKGGKIEKRAEIHIKDNLKSLNNKNELALNCWKVEKESVNHNNAGYEKRKK